MICKNCKTAVDDTSKVCPNCGNKLNNNRNIWIIICILVVVAIAAIYFLTRTGPAPEIEELPEITEEIPETSEIIPTEEETEEIVIPQEPIETEAPIPTSNADLEKPIEEVWEMIDELIFNINTFYKEYSSTVTFISKNGYLFDYPAKNYVFAEDLVGLIDINEKYVDNSVLFFYLRPVDLKGYGDLRVSESEELKIFVGYETKEGFAISADNESGGIIPIEDLSKILDKYVWDHGFISNYPQDSDEFRDIIKTIDEYNKEKGENYEDGYDIRHMLSDNKYVSVVVSPKKDSTILKQYVLEFSGDVFSVVVGGIEKEIDHIKYVNDTIFDFNCNLLPTYNLAIVSKHLQKDFDVIVNTMKDSELITSEDLPVTFSSGTSEFIFLEFESGKHFVGNLEVDTWKMYPVESYNDAIIVLGELGKISPNVSKAPYHILKHF